MQMRVQSTAWASLPWNILSTTQIFSEVYHLFTAHTCLQTEGSQTLRILTITEAKVGFFSPCHLMVFDDYSQQLQLQQWLSCLSPEQEDPHLVSSLLQV